MHSNSLSHHESEMPFGTMDIPESLKLGIQELGYKSATAFQQGVFENFKNGLSVACLGQSNYGKSLAYNLPILAKIDHSRPCLQALIICDTKTQAALAAKECRLLSKHLGITVETASNLDLEACAPHILVCPAQELSLIASYIINNSSLATIFFDNLNTNNADKIITILSTILSREEVQILIFGNETIDAIKNQAEEVLKNVAFVNNSDQPKLTQAAKHIAHVASETEPKPRALLAALELHQPKHVIITCNEANECDLLARFLSRYGYKTYICSEESNSQGILEAIENIASYHVIIIQNSLLNNTPLDTIACMINYDMPEKPHVYEQITQFNKQAPGVERVIINLLSSRDLGLINLLKAQCLIEMSLIDLPSQEEVLMLSSTRLLKQLSNDASEVELGQFEALAQEILKLPHNTQAIALLLRSYLLRSQPSITTPLINNRRHDRERERPRSSRFSKEPREHHEKYEEQQQLQEAPALASSLAPEESSTRLYVTLGRQDGFSDLASLAQYLSEKSGTDLGHFSGSGMIRDRSAHIEVDNEVAQAIIDALHNEQRPESAGNTAAEAAAPIICERARHTSERQHRRPMRRHNNYQRRRPER